MNVMDEYELNKKERLMLLNQLEILRILYNNDKSDSHSTLYGEEDYIEELKEIIMNGYEYKYDKVFGFLSDPLSFEDGKFITDLFVLYDDIGRVVINNKEKFTENELHKAVFPGFDGNRGDGFYGYAAYLGRNYSYPHLYKLKGVEEEKERQYGAFNSHGMDSIYRYREMLRVYNEILSEEGKTQMKLTVEDVKRILEAA